MLDWRSLLSDLRIPWRDRGRNTSSGNINTCCPWCVEDTGFHLSISEEKEAFYCYRNPGRHKGTNVVKLLVGLGVQRRDVPKLLVSYSSGQREQPTARSRDIVVSLAALNWSAYRHSHEIPRCAHYLRLRGFSNPERLSLRFDLRSASNGIWANRILLPIKHDGQVLTWTGRAVVEGLEPKYEVEARGHQNIPVVYVPDERSCLDADRIVIVEGPLDALKIAAGAAETHTTAIALGGKSLSSARLMRLRELLLHTPRVDVVLDNDAGMLEPHAMMNEFRALRLPGVLRRLRVPRQYKDAGEMPEHLISDWLNSTLAR